MNDCGPMVEDPSIEAELFHGWGEDGMGGGLLMPPACLETGNPVAVAIVGLVSVVFRSGWAVARTLSTP